jgi:hypothetical protein
LPFGCDADWEFTWKFEPVEYLVDDPCPSCAASVIWCENQSLAEAIRVVGAPFLLYYNSENAVGRAGAQTSWQVRSSRLGGWTAGIHHVLDPPANTVPG